MPKGTGIATITFEPDAQPALAESRTVVTDSPPNARAVPFCKSYGSSNGMPQYYSWRRGSAFYVTEYQGQCYRLADNSETPQYAVSIPYSTRWNIPVTNEAGDRIALFSYNGAYTCSSTDINCTSWTAGANVPHGASSCATFGGGSYVAISNTASTTAAAYSTNALASWTTSTLPYAATWAAVAYGNGMFVAVANADARLAVSTDGGATWSIGGSIPEVLSGAGRYVIGYGNGIWAFLAPSTTNYIYTSPDAVTWTRVLLPTSGAYNNLAFGESVLFVSSPTATWFSANNGAAWTQLANAPNNVEANMVFGSGMFFVGRSVAQFDRSNKILEVSTVTRTTTQSTTTIRPATTSPGSNIAKTVVTGIPSIIEGASIGFSIMGDSTADHNIEEHLLADIKLSASNIITGQGFTINAVSSQRLEGSFKVRYAWAY